MAEYNVQQKQFIQEYKAQHKLTNQSDEQIMLFIQKDMQTNGVVYPGFEHLATSSTSASSTANGQIFDISNKSDENKGISIEKSSTTETPDDLSSEGKEVTTDGNGNTITTIKDGDEIIEQTISSTDEKGNNIETVVNYQDGKPIKQTKKKNGNIDTVTNYKYHEASEENKLAYVTLETEKADSTKVITTALETDKYGNVDQEDFISRKTISRDGTETSVYIQDGNLLEQKVKFDSKKVTTMYNGTNLNDYDAHKLHRLVQETEEKGVKRYALYDGKGNTKTTVQNGESPALIAQKFKVKENTLRRLNPQKGKKAINQVGADILIPGEFNADSYPMRVRKSKEESLNKYSQFEANRLAKEINSGDVQNTKLSKSYNNVYELAKDNLIQSGVKNPSNQQVNDEANKLILLNGKNVNLKAGASVKVAKSLTNSKQALELTKYGFQASAENKIFFQKFNALNPQQKQNVLSAIQYCKSQNMTNPSDIKAKVLETLGINLFDSDKTVPMVAENNYGVMAYQRNSKPISIETFVKDHLKLDIKSEPGKTVLDRLSQVEQAKLNKISAKDFKAFNNKTLDGVASMLETVGIQIRTQEEINVKNNSPRAKAEKEKRAVRTAAAENIALSYDNAINVIKNYQGNQGWMNVGYYREKLGQLLDKVNPTNVATCFDAVIKRLEKEKQFAVSRLKTASANESEFKQAFKDLTGKDYNENAVKNFIVQAQKGGDWTIAYDKAFGDRVVKYATDKVNFQQYFDGAGDIVLMLLGTEAIGKGVAWAGGKVATKLAPYVPKALSKLGATTVMTVGGNSVTTGRVVGSMATSAATFTTWDATKNYINLKTKDIQYSGEDAVKEWQAYKEGNVESAKFGAFAGLLNSTVVGKVVSGTMKLFEKPVAKAMQGVTKTLEKGEAVTGADVMKTFIAKQTPGMIAKTAGTVAEVAGFTMYETANEVTKELLKTDANGQRHLPKDLTEEGLTNYLWKHLKGQAANLGEIKAISKLIFMHKGAIVERERMMNENLSKCEMLNKVKVQKAEVNGREIYEVTMPNGNRKVAHSPEEIVAYCNNLMLMDMAMNSKTTTTEANPNENLSVNTPKSNPIEESLQDKLEKSVTRDGFVAIRDEIKKMPNSPEKKALIELYTRKYQDWSTRRVNGNDPNKYSEKPNMAVKNMVEDKTTSKPEITSENFEQQKADLIKDFNEKSGEYAKYHAKDIEKISTPEDLAAVKEFWEWATNTEEGKKQFRGNYDIIEKINAKNIADVKELAETMRTQKDSSDDVKSNLLYGAIYNESIKETKEFIQGIEPSDLSKLNELDDLDILILAGPSSEQKAKLDFYKELKTGKYNNLIKDDNIFKHILSISASTEKTKTLYDTFAGENISKELFDQIKEGLENSDPEAIKQLYSQTKDLMEKDSDMNWIMFRNLKQEDIPAKIEIINTLKSAKASNKEICEILNKTNKNNLDVAKDLVQKAFGNGDEKAEKYNIVIILNKLNSSTYSKEFVEKNADALLHLDSTCIRKTTEINLELARKISENKEISSFQVDEMLKYATDEKSTQKLINNIDNGITKLPEIEVMNKLREDFIEIIKKHLPPERLQELENSIEDKEEFEKILIGQARSQILKDVELSPEEEKVVNYITRISPPLSQGATPLYGAGAGLESYFEKRNKNIYDMNDALENASYKDEVTKQQTLAKFKDLYPLLSAEEISNIKDIYFKLPVKERLNIDYSLIAKREIIPLLRSTRNYDFNATEKALEFLNCSDAEFKQKKHNLETRTQELHNEWELSKWKQMLNMPEAEFNRLKIPFELRTEAPVDINAYEAQMREKMADRITYDPIEAAKLIERAEKKQSLRNERFGNDYEPDKINAFEKLPKKAPVAITPLPTTSELRRELRESGHVEISIPNEGGVKVKPYDAVIHPEDNYRLNVTEDAGMKIRYGTKLQWSGFKIARDLLQNYYDGHGHTLEGVNIEVNKTSDGKYKIKISGESSWDYTHLDQMGSSTKHDPLDAGGYGEGTRAVAVSLLSKADITNVKYASGDWAMTYGRSSDDLKSAYMTQTLSKNSEKVKGSTVEFETTNAEIANRLLEAKDYFYHPRNPDFKNFDYENEFFGFKLKDNGEEGNLYLIQRYETNNQVNNGLEGATIVFKTQPNHPTLVEKDGGQEFKLDTGVDRAQIPSYDVYRILSRYIKTMTDEELTQAISSMEKCWGEGGTEKEKQNKMYIPFVFEARSRGLGIDFKDSHYIYLDKPIPSSVDMAKNLGYKIADTRMKDVGMQSFYAKDASKLPHQPTEEQSKEIRLLEEGVRILQECTDMSTKDLLNIDEVNKQTYMFAEGDHGTGAEAIIEGGEYQGHWMRDSHLLTQNYVGNLATFLHEISHKVGGDESEVFSNQLAKLQSHITNAIMHNPNALKKIQTLSKMFDEVRSQEFNKEIKTSEVIQDKTFTPEQYKQHIDNLLSVTPEYKEYVEPEPPKEPEPIEFTGEENRIGRVKLSGDKKPHKLKFKKFEENKKATSKFNIAGIKRFAKSFIHKILRHNPSKIEEDGGITLREDDFASFTLDLDTESSINNLKIQETQKPQYKYETFIPSKHESYTTLKSSDSMMKELDEKGSVALSIPNAGGLNPKISGTPRVEKDPAFNKTVPAKMTISYAEKRDWSNEKIARDLMQNFYDGNGHTLEGVDLKVTQNDNGTYTIRIDGKGIYNYEHLKRLGGSDKDDPRDAGGFGEGSRIIAGSLLAKGSDRVRFACKDWQMDFTKAENNRTNEECVMSTLTKSEKPLDGNYVEFDTNDKELVKKIMDSKNYFYSPNNPDFRDLDIENEFFGFKVSPDKNGNLYYIQRFQTPDKKMDNGLENMTLVFKQAAFGENFQNKAGYTIDLNTTRDRMAIAPEQMQELARAYAKTLPDTDIVKAISALEPIFTSDNCNSDKFKRENNAKNLSYQFAKSIIQEAKSRGIKIDFGDKKIVYVKESSQWRPSLTTKEEEFFKKEGYIFANMGTEIGIEDAESLYEKLHRPHSIKPNKQQTKQLQILDEAVKLITENDEAGLFPKDGTQLYAFDETSNIESKTGYYAAVNSDKLDGVFIDTKTLQSESFPTMLTNILCEMLEHQTDKALSSYSYNQTELIRSQLNTLITQPQIVEKLNILEQMYKEQQK